MSAQLDIFAAAPRVPARYPGGARECWTAHAVSEGLEHWRRSLEGPAA